MVTIPDRHVKNCFTSGNEPNAFLSSRDVSNTYILQPKGDDEIIEVSIFTGKCYDMLQNTTRVTVDI